LDFVKLLFNSLNEIKAVATKLSLNNQNDSFGLGSQTFNTFGLCFVNFPGILMRYISTSGYLISGCRVVSTVASQQQGSWFESWLGPFCVEITRCPRVCMASLWVLWLHPRYVRLIYDSKLTLRASDDPRSECGWLFVSVWPCDGLGTCLIEM